jgi:hypothetical protein
MESPREESGKQSQRNTHQPTIISEFPIPPRPRQRSTPPYQRFNVTAPTARSPPHAPSNRSSTKTIRFILRCAFKGMRIPSKIPFTPREKRHAGRAEKRHITPRKEHVAATRPTAWSTRSRTESADLVCVRQSLTCQEDRRGQAGRADRPSRQRHRTRSGPGGRNCPQGRSGPQSRDRPPGRRRRLGPDRFGRACARR